MSILNTLNLVENIFISYLRLNAKFLLWRIFYWILINDSSIRWFIHSSFSPFFAIYLSIYLFIYLFIHSFNFFYHLLLNFFILFFIYLFIHLFIYLFIFYRFLDFKQREIEMREIREDEEYERDAGDGSLFSYLTNGCFRKNKNMNKCKYVRMSYWSWSYGDITVYFHLIWYAYVRINT